MGIDRESRTVKAPVRSPYMPAQLTEHDKTKLHSSYAFNNDPGLQSDEYATGVKTDRSFSLICFAQPTFGEMGKPAVT